MPEAVERWIRHYEEKRNDGEDFNAFVDRTGSDQFEELISDLKLPVEFSAREPALLHRLEPLRALQGRARRGRVRRLMEPAATEGADREVNGNGRKGILHEASATEHAAVPRELDGLGFDPEEKAAELEDAQRRGGARLGARDLPARALHRLLVPEDELGDRPHGDTASTRTRASSTSTPTSSSRRPTRPSDRLEERYGINFHRYSSITLEQQAGLYGDELWSRDPDSCCGIRKVEPMR